MLEQLFQNVRIQDISFFLFGPLAGLMWVGLSGMQCHVLLCTTQDLSESDGSWWVVWSLSIK